ncbi:hypothetical protein KSZ_77360 [Dictyobacter formicarum]|uniref:Uncharacterized protein n=1 Tax=Dictyobacter formicarum TaxID=2778368 RepID=A0ABQ3VVB0_9CHLR|nr:hypothetical protein KSZ_77360 [Dictyobacter formicarum]
MKKPGGSWLLTSQLQTFRNKTRKESLEKFKQYVFFIILALGILLLVNPT